MSAGEVHVSGLRELQREFAKLGGNLKPELRKSLREVAEPVKADAERLSVSEIKNIGARWSRMRIGVTTSSVYVAPATRRSAGSPRANLGNLLMRAMQDALEQGSDRIEERLRVMLDELTGDF